LDNDNVKVPGEGSLKINRNDHPKIIKYADQEVTTPRDDQIQYIPDLIRKLANTMYFPKKPARGGNSGQ